MCMLIIIYFSMNYFEKKDFSHPKHRSTDTVLLMGKNIKNSYEKSASNQA